MIVEVVVVPRNGPSEALKITWGIIKRKGFFSDSLLGR